MFLKTHGFRHVELPVRAVVLRDVLHADEAAAGAILGQAGRHDLPDRRVPLTCQGGDGGSQGAQLVTSPWKHRPTAVSLLTLFGCTNFRQKTLMMLLQLCSGGGAGEEGGEGGGRAGAEQGRQVPQVGREVDISCELSGR